MSCQAGVSSFIDLDLKLLGYLFMVQYSSEQPQVKTILARHEQGAAIMADAYARASGKPAVAPSTPYNGFTAMPHAVEASGDGDKVIGMGDHFPDFLREPSKPKRGGKN